MMVDILYIIFISTHSYYNIIIMCNLIHAICLFTSILFVNVVIICSFLYCLLLCTTIIVYYYYLLYIAYYCLLCTLLFIIFILYVHLGAFGRQREYNEYICWRRDDKIPSEGSTVGTATQKVFWSAVQLISWSLSGAPEIRKEYLQWEGPQGGEGGGSVARPDWTHFLCLFFGQELGYCASKNALLPKRSC